MTLLAGLGNLGTLKFGKLQAYDPQTFLQMVNAWSFFLMIACWMGLDKVLKIQTVISWWWLKKRAGHFKE